MPNLNVIIGGNATKLKSVIKGVKSEVGGLGKSLSGMAGIGGFGLAGLATGFMAITKKAADAADSFGKGAKRISVSTDEYQRLYAMAENSGASVSSVEASFKRMSKTIVDANDGLKESKDALAGVGYSVEELQGLAPDEQFRRLAAAIAAIEDPTERAGRAQQVFGRGAMELMPLIMDYQNLRSEVEATQSLMDGEAIAAAEKFNDTLRQMGENIQTGLVNSGMMEWLSKVSEGAAALAGNMDRLKSSANVATQEKGGFSGLMQNMGQAFFGEEEGMKLTSGPITRSEVNAALKLKEEKEKVESDRNAANEAAKVAGEAERKRKEFEAGGAKASQQEMKKQSARQDILDDMAHEISQQQLINAEKEREAAIEDALYNAKKKNLDLTEEQQRAIADQAGTLYDLRNTELPKDEAVSMPRERTQESTSLERIGAVFGGAGTGKGKELNTIAEQSKRQNDWLRKIYERTGEPGLGLV